jgi:hypothetical protein
MGAETNETVAEQPVEVAETPPETTTEEENIEEDE